MQPSIRQKILSIILLLVLSAAAFYYYRIYGGSIGKVTEIIKAENTAPVGEDILVLVQKLNYVNIDDSIFSSPMFSYLKDYTVLVNVEDKSRPNPFAPIINTNFTASAVTSAPVEKPKR